MCRNVFSFIHFTVYCIGVENLNSFKIFFMLILEKFLFTLQRSTNEEWIKVLFVLNIIFSISAELYNILPCFINIFRPIFSYLISEGLWHTADEHGSFWYAGVYPTIQHRVTCRSISYHIQHRVRAGVYPTIQHRVRAGVYPTIQHRVTCRSISYHTAQSNMQEYILQYSTE